jgi:hypothetical protein
MNGTLVAVRLQGFFFILRPFGTFSVPLDTTGRTKSFFAKLAKNLSFTVINIIISQLFLKKCEIS